MNLELLARDAVKGVERGDVLIVVDVLRCSSTIVTALANGALGLIPVATLKEALKHREKHPEYVLAGERNGLKPEGFDLGNSPLEFVPEKVAGKRVVVTTTSGTMALTRSKKAEHVLIGAFLNAQAVAEKSLEIAKKESIGISLILSGRKGNFSLEDFLCAGAIISNLGNKVELSDAAVASLLSFEKACDHLYENVLKGEHARYLVSIGFEGDVEFCCRINHNPSIIPIYKNEVVTLLS